VSEEALQTSGNNRVEQPTKYSLNACSMK